MNRELIGKQYEQVEPFEVTAAGAVAYADASSADIAAYLGDDAVAPPMYGVAYSFGALTAPVLDGDLQVDLMRLVHGEQDMRFLKPVKPGAIIRSVGRVDGIDEKSSGELLRVGITSTDDEGDVVLEVTSTLFIKASRRGGSRTREKAADAPDPFEQAPTLFSATQKVADDQSVRYAEASGDRNPIHVDEEAAQGVGLPGVILHGLCTMAFVHNALTRHFDGDPTKVARLAVRFSKPVLMGDELTIDVRGPKGGPLRVRVTNPDGQVVLDNGVVELAA
jgi:acyl dehydratase